MGMFTEKEILCFMIASDKNKFEKGVKPSEISSFIYNFCNYARTNNQKICVVSSYEHVKLTSESEVFYKCSENKINVSRKQFNCFSSFKKSFLENVNENKLELLMGYGKQKCKQNDYTM